MIKMKPSQLKDAVILAIKAGVVPFISGSPGIGKSSIIKSIAEQFNLQLIDLRLSQMEPTDLSGLPWFNQGKAQFQPFDMFPLENTPIPAGKQGWLLFLDEMNSANKQVQAAAYKLVLDRQVGNHNLNPNLAIVCAGNLSTDNAIVNRMSTAMQSRLVHYFLDVDYQDWMNDVAIPQDYHEVIIGFINMFPDKLFQFDPEKEDYTFATPRTWEFANRLIKANGGVDNKMLPVLAGTLTEGIAAELIQFSKVYANLPTIDQITSNPNLAPPSDAATCWALTTHLSQKVDKQSIGSVMQFMKKMPASFKTVFFRTTYKHKKNLYTTPEMLSELRKTAKYLFGD